MSVRHHDVELQVVGVTVPVQYGNPESIFNPRRMREGYGSCSVCLSVNLSVCLLPR